MVSIGPSFSQPPSQPMKDASGGEAFALSKGIGPDGIMPTAALPASRDVLAFVPSPVPGSERTVLDILSRILPGATGAAGQLFYGIVSKACPLLFVLNTSDTADTTQMQALVRRLEAEGIDPRNVSFGMLPNGDLGVYRRDPRNPDDPFPELLATINGQTGAITTQTPSGAPDFQWNPGNHSFPEWDRPDIQRDGWQPRTVQIDQMPRNPLPDVSMEGDFFQGQGPDFDEIGRRMDELQERGIETSPPSRQVPRPFFDPKEPRRGGSFFDNSEFNPEDFPRPPSPNDDEDDKTGAPELPPSRPLHGGSAQNDDAVERLQEALEAARRVILDPGGFFGDGVDPRDEMYRRFGYIGLFAFDVVNGEQGVQDGTGGTSAAAGASTRVATYLSLLPAEIAAAIVNHLAGRLGAVPEMYRDALAQALEKGDPEDPAIERARTLLENIRKAEDEEGPEEVPGAASTTHVDLGQDEALREQILEELGDIANIDQFSDDLDRDTIQRAVIAGQIIAAIMRDPSSVIAVRDADGTVLGVGSFSFRETENGEPAIFVNDILALVPGHNVGLQLLQAIYDLGPGIMKLLSLTPELDDYYTARGGQNLGCPPGPGDSCSRFRWDERPRMVGKGEEGTPSTGELNMPGESEATTETAGPFSTHVFGEDAALDARTLEELDRLIALGESGVPLDPRTEAAAMIADQIRKNLSTADHVLVALGPEGEPLGVMTYIYFANPDDPTGPRVLFIEDIVSFVPGQGIGLKLLQEAFDRSEGIIGLTAMPGALEYYLSLGARLRDEGGTGLLPYLLWTDRPERREP